ncbi:hypothetical protein [Paenibacillus sp. MMS18-CY102]|uniref:hypothetical protein n=1 Tax=Paenibacillus sp. MMS18-CY102 TaxID=2682849 RepID=UPI0013652BF2|nr:hypothetical protein [Paenibacillus sp. MMS18-CY102]MWC31234.1 hypothetical protein [Paenibacillus sp. MMS18-CY102]
MKYEFDFKSGEVVLNDFDFDSSIPYIEQRLSFKEDILQVRYHQEKYVIDLGWYPEFNFIRGGFKLMVVEVQDGEWHKLYVRETTSIEEIVEYVYEAIAFVESIND